MTDVASPSGASSLSTLARGLTGSEILRISAEIRGLCEKGGEICNLTVGDFSPKEFRIPLTLERLITEALAAGETNYPPSDGVKELRQAVVRNYADALGLDYPIESTLIAGGARPLIFAAFAAVVDPGDSVVYTIPSWNNNHYTYLMGGKAVEIAVGPDTNFLPTAELLRPHIREARLVCVCTPLNPTGTVMSREETAAIARLVVEENERREGSGQRPLFLLWDQVYWTLTFGDCRHYTPPQLVPESKRWTIFIDGISKAFAATGLRVGWTVGPPEVTARMRDILGHLGAWAPRAEQVAVARYLGMREEIATFHETMIREVRARLDLLYDGFELMRREGLPVRAIVPQGAIYLSVQFALIGRGTIKSNDQIRKLLLEQAGFAVVPFQAFGPRDETGWFRLSVGAVSLEEIAAGLSRVRSAMNSFG